jgi:tRNA pseudouridine38-40 synthase
VNIKVRFFYLIKFQYLGFRFHGWQKQTDSYRTVQGMLERTLHFIFDEKVTFKTMGASRTDSMVSANESYCKLTTESEVDPEFVFKQLNKNLPADIKAISVETSTREFRIINDSKSKTYHYYFSNIEKAHPFSAPYITNFSDELDIEIMKKAAKVFEGQHNFSRYCFRPTPTKQYIRTINSSEIKLNTQITASFFPEKTYVFEVRSSGFLRNQIRLMMGALVMVGSGQMTLEQLEESLVGEEFKLVSFIAPASGLMLKELTLQASD